MERLTRKSKVGEGLPIKHLNLMHMDTTSEDTLTEILDKLAEYEEVEEKCGYSIGESVHNLSSEILRLKDEHLILHNQLMETEKELLRIRADRDKWKDEAIEAVAKLGEIRIAIANLMGGN